MTDAALQGHQSEAVRRGRTGEADPLGCEEGSHRDDHRDDKARSDPDQSRPRSLHSAHPFNTVPVEATPTRCDRCEPIAVGVGTRLPSSGYTVTTSEVLRGDRRTRTESNPKK
jgi:hypothetical protein